MTKTTVDQSELRSDSRHEHCPLPSGILAETDRPPVAQFLAAGTFVVDPFPDSQHFLIPVIAGAHRDAESVARLPNCLAIDEHQLIKRRLLRLRRVIDSPPESPIDDEASLAFRIHAAPGSRTRTVASSTLCFPSTEDAWGIGYGGADTVSCKDEIEQRIQQVLPAFLRIARPDDQCALRVGGCCGEFGGAFVGPVQSVNQRGSHRGVELKIEVTHSRLPLLRWAQRVQTCPSRIAATWPSTVQRLQGGTALLHIQPKSTSNPLAAQPSVDNRSARASERRASDTAWHRTRAAAAGDSPCRHAFHPASTQSACRP